MKEWVFHIVKYIGTPHYYVVHATALNSYPKFHGDSALKVKLIKVFDDREEAIKFASAMNLL